jgi:hypothetical protein
VTFSFRILVNAENKNDGFHYYKSFFAIKRSAVPDFVMTIIAVIVPASWLRRDSMIDARLD